MQIIYSENRKLLTREIKENLHKWRNMLCSWIGRPSVRKLYVLSTPFYKFDVNLIKKPDFVENDKLITKCMWGKMHVEMQRIQNRNSTLKQEE